MSKLSDNLSQHLDTLRTILISNVRADGALLIRAELIDDLSAALECFVRWAGQLEQQAGPLRSLPDPVMLPGTNVVPFAPRHRPQPSTGGDAA
ncbi:hypothetical protein V6L76_17470 [Pannonibacter sp. Pt2]|uniref:Uncharacterized protein n=1 Tax=Pannonibacter anstelovis TaxID=3121537 RepID=A0ABU7ZSQ1_9HYPH